MQTVSNAIDNDPDTDVKKKAVFALSQMPRDEGVPKMIEVARTNRNAEVRRQAMFWLGQSGDPRALRFFEEVLRKYALRRPPVLVERTGRSDDPIILPDLLSGRT